MTIEPLPVTPTSGDFRALARSSPWRFSTLHFTHRRRRHGVDACHERAEAWLDRGARRVTVRSPRGVEVSEGRPDGWHCDHGDPMWQDYQWTAVLNPAELSEGVDVRDVEVADVLGRLTWSAICRPLVGEGADWTGGYNPRCGCCPLLDSGASRLLEYGPDDPTLASGGGSDLTNQIHGVDEPLEPAR